MATGDRVVLLTRFNLPSEGVEGLIRAKEGWLRDRVALFERFTFPSVRAQSERPDAWLVYFDPESPQWLRECIEHWELGHAVTPLFRAAVTAANLRDDIRGAVSAREGALITANLDNDDAISIDFVKRLKDAPSEGARNAIYLCQGLVQSQDHVYLRRDDENAFCAVRDESFEPTTCWIDWHNRLEKHMPAVRIQGAPAWLQIIHGANVSNRARGKLTSGRQYVDIFAPGVLSDVEPKAATRMSDAILRRPLRRVRDRARTTLRGSLVSFLGKDGYDRTKHIVAMHRKRLARGRISP